MNSLATIDHLKIDSAGPNLLEFDRAVVSFVECDRYEWAMMSMPLDFAGINFLSGSRGGDAVELLIKAVMVVLYRNSYQSVFDLPVVNVGLPSVDEGAISNVRFEINADEKLWDVVTGHKNEFGKSVEGSRLSVVITNEEIGDHQRHLLAPITFVIYSNGDEVRADWIYRKSPEIEAFTSRIQGHLQVVLSGISGDLNKSLMTVEMLTEEEIYFQSRVGKGLVSSGEFVSLVNWVDSVADIDPDRPAVRFEGVELTYSSLVENSRRFAAGLKSFGVNKGDRVAILIDPCYEILIAILGIHRVGAVYVPIDPSFPASRITTIIEDCSPKLVVTDSEDFLGANAKSISVDQLLKFDPLESIESICPEDTSHIFFTSGTTGKPKGVVATHSNLFHYLGSAVTRYGFKESDRFIAAAKITFSISLFEILVPLAAGASVTILPRHSVLDMEVMCREMAESTAFHFGPSLLKRLLSYIEENCEPGRFDRISHASTGGDLVPPEILERMQRVFRKSEIYVIYGCSEISCMGCTFELPQSATLTRTPVGRPHRNTGVILFDLFGNRVPVGVPGSVYFSGPGLVKEYLNQPELSSSRFLDICGTRHYDTGDLGRLDLSGDLEIIGRDDFQVKIRGIRIELQEIERWLKAHPLISDAVVVARRQRDDEKSLVAYIVSRQVLASDQLIGYLSDRIPDYMVPAIFVRLEVLPTNHNGKLDRSQLPPPEKGNMLLSADYQSARDDVEIFLVDLWQRLFSLRDVGIDDNFFELGGDSLRAVQMFSEIEKRFDRRIAIDALLAGPTIRAVAEIVRSDSGCEENENDAISVLIRGNPDNPPIFFLYGVLLYRDLAAALEVDRTMYGVSLPEDVDMVRDGGGLGDSSTYSSFENIVCKYVDIIRSAQPKGPYLLCGFSFGGMVALEVARELESNGEDVAMLAMIDSWRPGSLSVSDKLIEHFRMLRSHGFEYIHKKIIRKIVKIKNSIKNPLWRRAGSLEITCEKSSMTDARKAARSMASRNYSPKVYDKKVLLFCAKKKSDFQPRSRDLGWKGILKSVAPHEVSGAHFSMLRKENVDEMALILRKEILGRKA